MNNRKKVIYFVRHGESDNMIKEDLIRPLTKDGEKKSLALIEVFRNRRIKKIYSSPYKRSVDTVKPL